MQAARHPASATSIFKKLAKLVLIDALIFCSKQFVTAVLTISVPAHYSDEMDHGQSHTKPRKLPDWSQITDTNPPPAQKSELTMIFPHCFRKVEHSRGWHY
jgi:hypothetical protein